MPSLRDQFEHFYLPDEQAVATAMKTGLVTPDANVLLALYRFQSEARDELFGALEKLGERLWIPHQVGLEFHRNRLNVMYEQQEFFSRTEQELDRLVEGMRGKVRAFGARIALSEDQVAGVEENIRQLQERVTRLVLGAAEANVYTGGHASDEILARIEALLGSRVGEPMEKAELEAAREEGMRRVDADLPPGYMDKRKPDPTGDYLIWRQLMNEAKVSKLPVLFITDDRKEDWYRREHGLILGARHELREEMAQEAGVPLHMMTTETFLRLARTHLNAAVSEETVDQARDLPVIPPDSPGTWAAQVRSSLVSDAISKGMPGGTDLLPLAEVMDGFAPEAAAQVRRGAFEKYLEVKPWSSEGAGAWRYIKDFISSGQATGGDVARASGWLVIYEASHHGRPDVQEQPEV